MFSDSQLLVWSFKAFQDLKSKSNNWSFNFKIFQSKQWSQSNVFFYKQSSRAREKTKKIKKNYWLIPFSNLKFFEKISANVKVTIYTNWLVFLDILLRI